MDASSFARGIAMRNAAFTVATFVGVAFTGTAAGASEFLIGPRLEEELGGQTIKGYYLADKVNFVEVYVAGGRIAYKDDLKADAGKWNVRGKLFCTFYDKISGGCWYVVKHSPNCFEFHRESDHDEGSVSLEALNGTKAHARAARDSYKVTCDAWYGT
jgi:hypothetical protein